MSSFIKARIQTFKAAIDLSALQYRFMIHGATAREVTTSGANGEAVGILQNAPVLGDPAEIGLTGGNSLLEAGGTFAAGDALESDATGRGILVAGSGKHKVKARAIEAAVIGDIVEVERLDYEDDIA